MKALFNPATKSQSICIDLVDAQGDQIVHVALDLFHIPDQEEHLQQLDIKGLKARILCSMLDGPFDGGIQKALDRKIEII